MKRIFSSTRALLLPSALLAMALAACQSTAPTPPASPTPTPAATATPPARTAVATSLPPDGKWLKDDAGVEYFLERIPRQAGMGYKKIAAEDAVRLGGGDDLYMSPWGIPVRVASMDEEWVYIKVFRTGQVTKPIPPPKDSPEVVAARYRSEAVAANDFSFAPFDQGLPRTGQWRQRSAVADMNGDGHLDVVHGPARKGAGRPLVFLGDSAGNWRVWSAAKFPPYRYDYGAAATADFDGDGRLDIALGMHLLGFVVLVQRQPGVFEQWSQGLDYGSEGTFSSRAIAAADWNRDGRPDLIALGEGPRMASGPGQGIPLAQSFGLVIYLNNGDGTWKRQDAGTDAGQVFGDDLAVADLNRDGRMDVVSSTNAQGRTDLIKLAEPDGSWIGASLDEARANAYVRSVAVGDVNGDGRPDVALGYINYEGERWWTGIDLLLASADGSWERHVLLGEDSRRAVTGLGIGDLDGDGHADVAGVTGDGDVLVFSGDEKGRFQAQKTGLTEPREECAGYGLTVADLDRDGDAEILVGFAGEADGGGFAVAAGLSGDRGCPGAGSLRAWRVERQPTP